MSAFLFALYIIYTAGIAVRLLHRSLSYYLLGETSVANTLGFRVFHLSVIMRIMMLHLIVGALIVYNYN